MKPSMVRRFFLVISGVILVFMFLGVLSGTLVRRFANPTNLDNSNILFAKLLDRFNPNDRVAAIKELEHMNEHLMSIRFVLLDAKGNVIYSREPQAPLDLSRLRKLEVYKVATLEVKEVAGEKKNIVRLPGEPVQYLYTDVHRASNYSNFWATFVTQIVAVLLGLSFAIMYVIRSVRTRVMAADQVISDLQKGNLKARFKISKMDELGGAMQRFNTMADEIERLVEELRNTEKARIGLLQELAHDLRTPLASLRNLLETLHDRADSLDKKTTSELSGLALKEVVFFSRLTEDLLTLAQISEPRYNPKNKPFLLNELVRDEAESIKFRYQSEKNPKGLKLGLPSFPVEFLGDEYLVRRMVRNALENSFSFAKSEVEVKLYQSPDKIVISVLDDGGGFTKSSLESFGVRRSTREYVAHPEGRVSVGLGSVIMKTIAGVHRGSANAKNRVNENGNPMGAEITIELPGK